MENNVIIYGIKFLFNEMLFCNDLKEIIRFIVDGLMEKDIKVRI